MNAQFWRRISRRGAAASLASMLLAGVEAQDASAPAGTTSTPAQMALVASGHQLFLMNCAHCHAKDATGDEGPDLHGVKKSDARIATMIKNGVQGEMPKFGNKLSDADVQALIAFIRSLH